jgi:hypothetical protein
MEDVYQLVFNEAAKLYTQMSNPETLIKKV